MHSELKDVFLTFDKKMDRIDLFYAGIMLESASCKDCWEIFKFVFTLSHGQASIEREFSINQELLVENLQEESMFVRGWYMIMSTILESQSLRSR